MGIETHKDFDQVVKGKLQQHEVMPPDAIWAGIQDAGIGTAAKSSNWKWWAAASVLAFVLTASSYFYFYDDSDQAYPQKTNQTIVNTNNGALPDTKPNTEVEVEDKQVSRITEENIINDIETEKFTEEKINNPLQQKSTVTGVTPKPKTGNADKQEEISLIKTQ